MLYVVCGFGLITGFSAVHEYLKMNMKSVKDFKVFDIGIIVRNMSKKITINYSFISLSMYQFPRY